MPENEIQHAAPVPPFVTFVTSAVPMVFDNSMSYYEALCALWKWLQDDVIDVINNNASVTNEYINLTNQLHDFVENYFDNLDVQEEINNKLDSMVEDGSFQIILDNYVEPKLAELDQKIVDGLEAEETARENADNVLNSMIGTVNTNLQAQISGLASGSPLVASSTAGMSDTSKVYVNTSNGKWYYYDGDSWEIGGTYQSSGIDPDDPAVAVKLDKQDVLESVSFTTNDGWISTSNTVFPNAGDNHYQHVIIPNVSGGDTYYISGYSVNTQYPGARIAKPGVGGTTFIESSATTFADYEITIPDNRDGGTLYINGWLERQGVAVKKMVKQSSADYWDEFTSLKDTVSVIDHQLCGRKEANNIYFFKHGYKTNVDLFVWFNRKAMNNLMDFLGWFTTPNTTTHVITTCPDAGNRTQIIGGSTDWLAPSIVYATSDIDGDFPSYTGDKFTGGWHGYNNATAGSNTATAREISCKLYVDGVEVNENESKIGHELKLIIVNNLQGSNTEKSDGSGREIIQQKFIITMTEDSNKVYVESEVKALEDVILARHYGLSMYRANTSDVCYMIGSHDLHTPFNLNESVVRDTSKATCGVKEIVSATSDTFVMMKDNTYSLGDGYANKSSYGLITASSKAYEMLVFSQNNEEDGIQLSENGIVRWRGYYDVNPTLLV